MRRARYLWPLLFVWALLGAESCSESTINEDINAVLGINTDSPVEIAGAILLGQTFGNADEQKAAAMGDTLKDFRRADHEQQGDVAYRRSDYNRAVDEYNTALQWTGSGVPQDRKRADLHERIGETIADEIGEMQLRERPVPIAAKRATEAATAYARVAELRARDPDASKMAPTIAALRRNEARMHYLAGNYGSSCSAIRQAEWLANDPIGYNSILREGLAEKGLRCT